MQALATEASRYSLDSLIGSLKCSANLKQIESNERLKIDFEKK
jgi:hypothetical protein